MNCPYCETKDQIQTLETRSKEWGIKRIKKCLRCGEKFSTIEVYKVTDEALKSLQLSNKIRRHKLEKGVNKR